MNEFTEYMISDTQKLHKATNKTVCLYSVSTVIIGVLSSRNTNIVYTISRCA